MGAGFSQEHMIKYNPRRQNITNFHMNRLILTFALLLLTALPLVSCIHTKADTETTQKKCGPTKDLSVAFYQDTWDELWPQAKAGDMKARGKLYALILGIPHMSRLVPPGSSPDLMTAIRHLVILEVHLVDYWNQQHPKPQDKLPETDTETLRVYFRNNFFLQVGFDLSPRGKRFLKCAALQSGGCANQAVEDGLVPSFDEYIAQIDQHVENGAKASCAD